MRMSGMEFFKDVGIATLRGKWNVEKCSFSELILFFCGNSRFSGKSFNKNVKNFNNNQNST